MKMEIEKPKLNQIQQKMFTKIKEQTNKINIDDIRLKNKFKKQYEKRLQLQQENKALTKQMNKTNLTKFTQNTKKDNDDDSFSI